VRAGGLWVAGLRQAASLPEAQPMLDEFSVSGARAVADVIPNRELVF
jgi:hypothetical protein